MDTREQKGYPRDVPRVDVAVTGIPQPLASYTPAARAGNLVFAAGQLASDFKQGVAAAARVDPAFPYYGSAIKKQTRYVLENLAQTFKAAGTSLNHVVKAQVFQTDLANFNGFDEVWREFFPTPPPRTTIGTPGLLVPGTLVEIDLIAAMPTAAGRVVQSDGPRPLASYSEAVVVGDLVFAAGQLASDFKTGVPREARVDPAFPYYGSDIKRQTRFILENLARTFKAAGTSLDRVVKAQVFHTDLRNFFAFDEVWREFFPAPPPRTTVGTTGLLVKDTLVEIDLIAALPSARVQPISVPDIPRPLAHYTPATRVGDLVLAAGQIASDYATGVPREARVDPAFPFYGSDIQRQTRYVLENLAKTLKAAGTSLDQVVKAQVFHTDLENFAGFDEVWKEFFTTPPPRTTVGTTGLLVPGTLVEIDLIAATL
ncbi:MAG TPA: RidA family protein [Candidatus Binatia bacterium]|nr:RidA family protein [Candidatus Binatia bacterium]